jgi:hypothetical protein
MDGFRDREHLRAGPERPACGYELTREAAMPGVRQELARE